MLVIGGLEKVSLLDYPDKVSAIVFTYGCNLKCPYCHNPELVVEKISNRISEKDVLDFLELRENRLDAVVVTGGEPLIQSGLPRFLKKIKDMGYLVKLDTNGLSPNKLQGVLDKNLVDYIAMDVKYPSAEYMQRTGIVDIDKKIKKSIDIIINSGLDYEFRTTYVKGIHTYESVEEIGEMIVGAKKYYIQNFRSGKSINSNFNEDNSFKPKELKHILSIMKKYVSHSFIR